MKDNLRIIFMGTPEFAVPSLKMLIREGFHIVAVVTAPDKPAGRGRRLSIPEVKKAAAGEKLMVFQPEKLKNPEFVREMKKLDPDLMVVVAFRVLPEEVFSIPRLGTINLHASLLPNYRGAAPINRVIMNGETTTGLSTFFIEKRIDTGAVIIREPINIGPDETAGELHDRMKEAGAKLLLRTVKQIRSGSYTTIDQQKLYSDINELKSAPKIGREDCRIQWDRDCETIRNQIRGLSPLPGAFTLLRDPGGKTYQLKILSAGNCIPEETEKPGSIQTDGVSWLHVAAVNAWLPVQKVQLQGRKSLEIHDFLRGARVDEKWMCEG